MPTDAYDHEPQDTAEVFDEDRLNEDDTGAPSAEMRTFEELPDVFDVTQRIGDREDDRPLDEAEFSEELFDDDDLEEDPAAEVSAEEDPYGLEEVVSAPDEVSLDYLGDLEELGYVDPETEEPK